MMRTHDQSLPDALVRAISERSGFAFELGPRLTGGEQGAWVATDPEGVRYVVKFDPDRFKLTRFERAAETALRLRTLSYPAPLYVGTGVVDQGCYAVMEMLPGQPRSDPPESAIPPLVRLNHRQRGQAPVANTYWIRNLMNSILLGDDGYCVVTTLQDHSDVTASLLRELQQIASNSSDLDVPADDIVHFDFHPDNILFVGDTITGVIDWDGSQPGDASFDLATLLFFCYEMPAFRATLWWEIAKRSGQGALRLYLAHMILRQVDWTIRFHEEATQRRCLSRAWEIINTLNRWSWQCR